MRSKVNYLGLKLDYLGLQVDDTVLPDRVTHNPK